MHGASVARWAFTVGVVFACGLGCAPPPEDEIDAQDSELSTTEVVEAGVALRTTARVNLRAGAGQDHDVVTVLEQNEALTTVTRSGGNGWVHVKTAAGEIGWAINKYVVRASASASGATCAEGRGEGVVGRYQKALHDSIAFAEGTEDHSKDGYDVMFSFKIMSSCRNHPNQCHRYGSTCSTAAGRYQILKDTWDAAKRARDLDSFEPENQERAAVYLIGNIRGVTVPQERAMTASEFRNALSKLSYEWASLPPGRHGQPNKTHAQMRSDYCRNAGC